MAGPRRGRPGQRPQRVGEQMRQVLSELLLGGAIKDPRVARADLVSFTEVRVTSDLGLARVFTSVFPTDLEVVEAVMAGLTDAAPHIRGLIAREMRLRHMPELRFHWDQSIDRGARMEALLREARQADAALAEERGDGEGDPAEGAGAPTSARPAEAEDEDEER